jgi:hypothetical protein
MTSECTLLPERATPAAHALPPGAKATALSPDPFVALTVTFFQAVPFQRALTGGPAVLLLVPTMNAVPPGPAAMPPSGW